MPVGLHARGLLDQEGGRRHAHLEGERAVRIDRDLHRDRRALLHVLRLGVERLAEFHDVDAALTERGPDRRRTGWRRPAGTWRLMKPSTFFAMLVPWHSWGAKLPGLAVNGRRALPHRLASAVPAWRAESTACVRPQLPIPSTHRALTHSLRPCSFCTSVKPSSTGVSRPKMDTATFSARVPRRPLRPCR